MFCFVLSYSHEAYLDYGGVHFDRFPAAIRAVAARCKLSFALRPGLYQPATGRPCTEVVGAPSEIGLRLTNTLAHAGRAESSLLLEEPENLDAALLQEKEEAEKTGPGLTKFPDGS